MTAFYMCVILIRCVLFVWGGVKNIKKMRINLFKKILKKYETFFYKKTHTNNKHTPLSLTLIFFLHHSSSNASRWNSPRPSTTNSTSLARFVFVLLLSPLFFFFAFYQSSSPTTGAKMCNGHHIICSSGCCCCYISLGPCAHNSKQNKIK